MSDLASRAKALSEKAAARTASNRAEAEFRRKQTWQRIQAEAHDLAQFMTDFNRVFGRPAKISVEINGERVI